MNGACSPKVSVIVPTFNRPALLAQAIDDVLRQTWQDLEVIIVDDAATTTTRDLVRRFDSGKVRLLSHTQPRGAAAARNTGLRRARGAYVAFLDDDDRWLPTKLSRQLDRLHSSAADTTLIYCGFETISERTGRVVKSFLPRQPVLGFADFLQRTAFGTSIPLIARRSIEEIGLFDEGLPGTHDRDLWLRLAKRFQLAFVPAVLARCVVHGEQITTDLALKLDAKEKMLRKYHDELSRHPAIFATQLVRLAMLHFAAGQPDRGRRCLTEALRLGAARRRDLRWHLMLSRIAPPLHRRYVQRTAFRRVDGLNLYY